MNRPQIARLDRIEENIGNGSPKYSRQLVLFLVSAVLPAIVLIGLAVYVIRQDSELAARRAADERTRAAESSTSLITGPGNAIPRDSGWACIISPEGAEDGIPESATSSHIRTSRHRETPGAADAPQDRA